MQQSHLAAQNIRPSFRATIFITALTLLITATSFTWSSFPIVITGHLKKNPAEAVAASTNGVTIFVKGDDRKLADAITDSKGNFTISFSPADEKSFDFFCTADNIDTLLIASFTRFESDTADITFYIPGIRKKNLFGKTICPKCKKADKVYYIVYENKQATGSNGATNEGDKKEEHSAPGKPAKYFCERDKVEF